MKDNIDCNTYFKNLSDNEIYEFVLECYDIDQYEDDEEDEDDDYESGTESCDGLTFVVTGKLKRFSNRDKPIEAI